MDAVALLLHLPSDTIESWAERGIIPSVKIGGRLRFRAERYEMWLREQEAESA